MRIAAPTLIVLAIAFPAAAQTTITNADQQVENRVWAQQQLQQQQAAAAQREDYVAQQRAQAQAAIAAVNARNAAMQAQGQPAGLAPLDANIAAADAAMTQAQARILAESNARILQVTGGSR